jgi:hypothetical protein
MSLTREQFHVLAIPELVKFGAIVPPGGETRLLDALFAIVEPHFGWTHKQTKPGQITPFDLAFGDLNV